MAIRTVVTRGFGNGTFNGEIGLVVTRGYVASSIRPFVRLRGLASIGDNREIVAVGDQRNVSGIGDTREVIRFG